jgi:isoamylase
MGIRTGKTHFGNAGAQSIASTWTAAEGSPTPLGVARMAAAYNFSIYSKNATRVTLFLYSAADVQNPIFNYDFDTIRNKTGRVWHASIPANIVAKARYYGYSIDGPPPDGDYNRHAFKAAKILLDPYGTAVYFPPSYDRLAALGTGSNAGKALLCAIPRDDPEFDWEDD